MKKNTEKLPIDDLFARKLGNMSLPPSADGFERLQARMNQQKPEPRLVFWRGPAVQPYLAAAACIAIVCLFGWLYWPSGAGNNSEQNSVAVKGNVLEKQKLDNQRPSGTQPQSKETEETPAGLQPAANTPQLADNNEPVTVNEKVTNPASESVKRAKVVDNAPSVITQVQNEAVMAQTKTVENKGNATHNAPVYVTPITPIETVNTDRVAENKAVAKPTPTAERVLEVTIAEPQALVAARLEAKAIIEEKTAVAQTDKAEKETKGSLWQQVKRIKQGEVFARQDDVNNEDRGLLGRAYSGLKNSLDKEKAAKQ
ncbi:hypothetical protein [Spirosoma fluviale]|uniref:Uncharacterized protein n=1 Tax=Spirosoma fluviale TaxID=1597977 RepID=A0A286GKK0_9BACT|nr:hypothetical protein [Spirosoma fluviale]SOD96061.1 hypothetical protein SAMN06269250_5117 [Spirosoma fluviale]